MILAAAALAWTAPPCTAERAVPATIEAITADGERWLDRCVAVSGITNGRQLYTGVSELYRSLRSDAEQGRDPADRQHRIGIDSRRLRENPRVRDRATSVRVVGWIDSCQRRALREVEAGFFFVGGPCHHDSGPRLVVTAFEMLATRHERQVGEVARRDLGNLLELPTDRRGHAHLDAAARSFAVAMRVGGRERLAKLIAGPDAWPEDLAEARRQTDRILRAPAYHSLRQGRAGAPRLFVEASGGQLRLAATHPDTFACFCRTADCAGLWPISTIDADAGADRPYVCIQFLASPGVPGAVSIIAPDGGGWLAEPDRRRRHTR